MQITANRSGVTMQDCLAGVRNLVDDCMGVQSGAQVLLVLEPEGQVFYDPEVARLIEAHLSDIGATVTHVRPAMISDPRDFPAELAAAMGNADHTLFLSRIGDDLRFTPMMGGGVVTISYARQLQTLGSLYAKFPYQFMSSLLNAVEKELLEAKHWKITCPLGTDLEGEFIWQSLRGGRDDEFSMNLFPVSTFKPVPANSANGRVVLSRWLMPGAAVKVGPEALFFDQPVSAIIRDGKLEVLEGDSQSVSRIEGYIEMVCSALDIKEKNVHSWHAGINPFTFFAADVDQNLQAWSAITFGSPRYLHFHTTGNQPPGEIAWSIFNPTVWIDGECWWREGQFVWLRREDNLEQVHRFEDGRFLLQESADIGA